MQNQTKTFVYFQYINEDLTRTYNSPKISVLHSLTLKDPILITESQINQVFVDFQYTNKDHGKNLGLPVVGEAGNIGRGQSTVGVGVSFGNLSF